MFTAIVCLLIFSCVVAKYSNKRDVEVRKDRKVLINFLSETMDMRFVPQILLVSVVDLKLNCISKHMMDIQHLRDWSL